jgi:mannose-6-phosphate isomerase-like protein (cupin superfamily)
MSVTRRAGRNGLCYQRGGSGQVVLCAHDPLTGEDHRSTAVSAPQDSVLIVDSVFAFLREGRVLVQVGDETVESGPGYIVVGPPGVPHGFTNLGPDRVRLVCIHAAPAMGTTFPE